MKMRTFKEARKFIESKSTLSVTDLNAALYGVVRKTEPEAVLMITPYEYEIIELANALSEDNTVERRLSYDN